MTLRKLTQKCVLETSERVFSGGIEEAITFDLTPLEEGDDPSGDAVAFFTGRVGRFFDPV